MTTRESAALVFYVEDDENIRDLTLYALRQAGFEGLSRRRRVFRGMRR